jgi:MOSC domain-containing protein YiiM
MACSVKISVFEGRDNKGIATGDGFVSGDLILEVTAPRMRCRILADKMNRAAFAMRYFTAAQPGFYCRVAQPSRIPWSWRYP